MDKIPEGWGLNVAQNPHVADCLGCKKPIKSPQQFLMTYVEGIPLFVHNLKGCWAKYHEDQIKWEQEQERKREKS